MRLLEIILGFTISYIGLSVGLPYLKKSFLDIPNNRSAHKYSKPKAGGVSFSLVTLFFSILNGNLQIISVIPLTIVGLIDDKKNLSASIRFIFQLFTCIALFFWNNNFANFSNFSVLISSLLFIFFIISGIALINFCNFMDGIDGLLAGAMLVIFTAISNSSLGDFYILIGALSSFIIFNWSPSKVFMGDIGSYFLGSIYVGTIYSTNSLQESFALILFSFPLIADCSSCIIRRFFAGQSIFGAHNLHLYQRLCRNNFSHRQISLLYILLIGLIVLSYSLGGFICELIVCGIVLSIGGILDRFYAVKFN